jgi:hypothetical protein
MSKQSHSYSFAPPIEAGQQVARLRHLLGQIEAAAGTVRRASAGIDALDESARFSASYERSLPVAQRRFDILADETATWTASVLETLSKDRNIADLPRAAVEQLAREIQTALRDMARTLRVQ